MPTIADTDRDHVRLLYGAAVSNITIRSLLWDYRCATCDGKLEARADSDPDGVIVAYIITCPTCEEAARDVKHTGTIRQERIYTQRVLAGLPEHLRDLINPAVDTEAAASALYPIKEK